MRTARPLGLSPDGTVLIVVAEGGEHLGIPADERLRAALRDDRPRLGQLEIDMDSALRPREIQARIRAGESLEQVAQAAGVPAEQIEGFAAPVIAEREHVAGLAQSAPVRRAGDTVAHRSLRSVVTERLLSRGVDVDKASWDAWRIVDRRWAVKLSYDSGSAQREAEFVYDQTGRFSVAANDDARWLLGEQGPSHGPQPGRRRRHDDDEATVDLNDELALVRAIQPEVDSTADTEDAYTEAELAEVDGVYDFVPAERSNIDVLYDMLSSFDEDSVQIYAGLVRARDVDPATPVLDEAPDDSPAAAPQPKPRPVKTPRSATKAPAESPAAEPPAVPAKPAASNPPEPEQPSLVEPEQPSLVEEEDEVVIEPTRPIKRKRASVPSWDEIVFGAPQPRQKR